MLYFSSGLNMFFFDVVRGTIFLISTWLVGQCHVCVLSFVYKVFWNLDSNFHLGKVPH